MNRLHLDSLPPATPAAARARRGSAATDDWQRTWDESGLPGGSGSNPTAEANRNDSVGLKSDLQPDTSTDEVTPFAADGSSQTCSTATAECRSDFSPTPQPESGTATLPPLQGEGRGGDGGEMNRPTPPIPTTSAARPFPGAGVPGTRADLKGEEQQLPRPLKAGQLAWQSTQAMAQRARRNEESGEIQVSLQQHQPAPLAVPMLAPPPLPHVAPQLPGELLLAAVERMLVTEADSDGEQRVHLTFASDWFNETAVTLSRTDGGWRLDIASASPRITAALRGACNELGSRFAQRGLGRLDTRIHTTSRWDSLEEDAS